MDPKSLIQNLLQSADIEVNGSRPEDIQVHDERLFARVLIGGSLGLGEAYMDGWWDCQALDRFFFKILRAGLYEHAPRWITLAAAFKAHLYNGQSRSRSHRVAEVHYDLGNDFYQDMLDPHMQYTCAYWRGAETLEEAQERKLDLICRKLQLKEGEHLLELGGGWGGFARFAAERYGCRVTSYNISKEQVKFAREWTQGLPVTIHQKDYREATGTYDKVVSTGLCEHVGFKNYRAWIELQAACLKDDGLMLLHTIGRNTLVTVGDPWVTKYIFPGGLVPCLRQLSSAVEGLFVLEDFHNIGPDYDPTLCSWYANYRKHLPRHKPRLGERFDRMWTYYLLSCAGAFRARSIQLWQMVFSKKGLVEGYTPVR
jgi:cyclopropane-fatty-acyl-phospholipid synthase